MARHRGCYLLIISVQTSSNGSLKSFHPATRGISGQATRRCCTADALAERAAKELRKNPVVDGKASPWLLVQEKSVRALTALSMRLRLSPQSRIDAKGLGRQEPRLTVNPWEYENDARR
jgi:hypothetical protein